jgi:hypothetical protein
MISGIRIAVRSVVGRTGFITPEQSPSTGRLGFNCILEAKGQRIRRNLDPRPAHESDIGGPMQVNLRVLIGIILLVGGILAAVYGGFTYTKDSHSLDLGPIDVAVQEEETVNIPLWAGLAIAAVGGVVLAVRKSA